MLAGIVLLGIAVRFPTLSEQSFWYDEAVTHGIVSHGLAHVFSAVPQTESTPPLYYVVLWLWSGLFGTTEVGLRSFSAICGTLMIPAVWVLARELVSSRIAHVAALLTAVSPLLFWYSQEARSYALLALLSTISLLALVRAIEVPRRRRLATWSLIGALALATHYFAIFLLVPEAIWLLISLRSRALKVIAPAFAPILLVSAALVPLAIHQNNGRASFIATKAGSLPFRLAQLVKQDVVAFDEPAKTITSIVALVLVLVGLHSAVRRTSASERRAVKIMASLAAGTIVLAAAVAAIGTDYVDTRNLLESWPALALVVAIGFAAAHAAKATWAALGALVTISVLCVIGVIVTPTFQRLDWRGVARVLDGANVPRAIVGNHQAVASFAPYMRGVSVYPTSAAVQEIDVFTLVYRPRGAHVSRSPSKGIAAPLIAGFSLVERRRSKSYLVLRYRAPKAVVEQRGRLIAYALIPHSEDTVLIQLPASRSTPR